MMNQGKNDCIQCSIHNCVHHAGTHEQNPTQKECTDCDSFHYKMS